MPTMLRVFQGFWASSSAHVHFVEAEAIGAVLADDVAGIDDVAAVHGLWTQRHQMSINAKFEATTRDDLLDVAERFNVPGARAVLGDVDTALRRWREFAEACGVEGHHVERIAGDIEQFRFN